MIYVKFIGLLGWTIFGISLGLFAFSVINFMIAGIVIAILGMTFSIFIIKLREEMEFSENDVGSDDGVIPEVYESASVDETTKVLRVIPDSDPVVKEANPEGIVSSFSVEGVPALTSTTITEAVDNKDIIAPGVYLIIFPDGTYKIGKHHKNVNLGIMEDLTSLNDEAYYLKRSSFMDFIQLDELERWMHYIVENRKITNIHKTIHLSYDDFKKRELGKILEFRNVVNDYFKKV